MSQPYPSTSSSNFVPSTYSSTPPSVPLKPQRINYPYNNPHSMSLSSSSSSPSDQLFFQWFFHSNFPIALYDEPIYANMSDQKRPPSRSGAATPIVDEEARYRVDAMERHLANLTGLVQQALSTGNSPMSGMNSLRSDSGKKPDYSNIYIPPKRHVGQTGEQIKFWAKNCGSTLRQDLFFVFLYF